MNNNMLKNEIANIKNISLKGINVDPFVLNLIGPKAANYYKVFPIKYHDGHLTVAMSTLDDVKLLDDITAIAKCKITPILIEQGEILQAIVDHYGVGAETIEQMMTTRQAPTEKQVVEVIDESSSEASISQFLNQVLYQAYKDKATDIHIEPFEGYLRVRVRIDGILDDIKVPVNLNFFKDGLISRVKILSNLNIAEKRLPQDGRCKVRTFNEELDLRVSFLPTLNGESCVIRILNSFRLYDLDKLGFDGQEGQHLNNVLKKPNGIVFLTGPTGSGKTTTLYSCLSELNKKDNKIITIEDPIEYQLNGIIQIQAQPGIGLTFANGLRSILRNDPDIIMIGEVRDFETAQIAIQMALTGHLVFSTLHTNDAASGIIRLIDIGIEPYLIAASVECFVAQRLVRILCPHCKEQIKITPEIIREFDLKEEQMNSVIYEAKGCKECRMMGYSGRQAISEFLLVSEEIHTMIINRSMASEIKSRAMASGMKTMRQHGWEKIIQGVTSPSEVLSVTENNR